jgi:hypothetical protein
MGFDSIVGTARGTAAFLAAVLLVACEAGPAVGPPRVHVLDSAGIEIVENEGPVWAADERWRIGEEPLLHIGDGADGDPELQFARIAGVHRLSDGGVAVTDQWTPAVSFFDASGELMGRFAQVGSGPGELPGGPRSGAGSVLGSFSCGADTVYVLIPQRVAAYAPPADFVRGFSLEPAGRIRACTGSRILAQRGSTPWRDEPGFYVDSVEVAAHDLDGALVAVLDTLPGDERVYSRGAHEGTGYARRAFGAALSVHGRDGSVATGFGDRFQIELRDDQGRIERIIRVPGRERPVRGPDLDRFRDYVFNLWPGNPQERAGLEEQLDEAARRNAPAFAELHLDRAGHVWAREYDHLDAVAFFDLSFLGPPFEAPRMDGPRRWLVFQPDGRLLGEVTMPTDFEVYEIGEDWVLGVWRDEMDIEYVRIYPILKGG